MESSHALATGARSTAEGSSSVRWVPDAEVKACPLCSRKFGFGLPPVPRHHCRSCGRVVCGYCSNNSVPLSGFQSKQRVCDTCFELHSSVQGAELDGLNASKQIEASLKAGLKEKKDQVDWCEAFLTSVKDHCPEAAASSSSTSPPTNGDQDAMYEVEDASEQRQLLIRAAHSSWEATEKKAVAKREEAATLSKECAKLQEELDGSAARVHSLKVRNEAVQKELQEAGTRMELETQNEIYARALREAHRELEGLKQRREALEGSMSRTSSFLSAFSNDSAFSRRLEGCRRATCTIL
mmetsp:Transcript_72304/g.172362  ORF Transcript_72304/g.172362 Transcript_72304/m.172362 type:complete len:296 (-) Transcript_72304:12-899(-)